MPGIARLLHRWSSRLALMSIVAIVAVLCSWVQASADDDPGYLPDDIDYDESIPTPESHFGFEVGEWHLRHHELVTYMHALANASDRITIEEYGRTYGNKPLVLLTITSERNHQNLEAIRERHVALCDPSDAELIDTSEEPVVIHLCYSVHGDESSGSNAAPLVAYYLAAAQGEAIDNLLDNAVILLDPCLNPDGFDRFAHWANDNRGHVLNTDPNHREHNQPWPGGRTNYYFFDLNRDWLPAQHPESRGRLRTFHRWKPNIQNDYHEMGTNSTYFFQPGVPARKNPLTPERNVELTEQIASFHARRLDEAGSAYFTEERFDDFYPGKGSTYPDLHGAIGVLFEQASSRGHAQESEPHGVLDFPFTIRNQVITSLSTFEAALDLRPELLNYQRDFYQQSQMMGATADFAGYTFSSPFDVARARAFAELLELHDIEVLRVQGDTREEERFFVPAAQSEYRFVQCLFEMRTSFEENVFYDVSAWTMPLAFNLQWERVDNVPTVVEVEEAIGSARFRKSEVAYVIDWRGHEAPAVVHTLLAADVRLGVAQKPFDLDTPNGIVSCPYGSILVPVGTQRDKAAFIHETLRDAARSTPLRIHAARGGLTPAGIDLGSGSFAHVTVPKVIVLSGEGISSYSAGEVWHVLDQRIRIPVTLANLDALGRIDLHDYTCIVMPEGSYRDLDERAVNEVNRWVRAGGTLIALGGAVESCINQGLAEAAIRPRIDERDDTHDGNGESATEEPIERLPYAEAESHRAEHRIAGAIFDADIDVTHPVGYGYEAGTLPVFLDQATFLEPSTSPFATPLVFTDAPLRAGYCSPENQETLAGAGAVVVAPAGRGRVVLFACDPLFRAHWLGTERLFVNAVFFGSTIRSNPGEDAHVHD